MPDNELEQYFELVKHQFFVLRIEWRLYRSLFGSNAETVELLNEISGPTAQTLERILFERCLLGLRRLSDPAKGKRGRSTSVTVRGFQERIDSDDLELKSRVSLAVKSCAFARNWSDKRIAHADLIYLQGKAKLETASRAKVEDALYKIANVIKWVSSMYLGITLTTHPIPPLDDERNLLRALFLGAQSVRQERELRQHLLQEKRYDELDKIPLWQEEMPDWLRRDDPPLDIA